MSLRNINEFGKVPLGRVVLWQYGFDAMFYSALGRETNKVSCTTPPFTLCEHFAVSQVTQLSRG
jgi:hypothetical protein